MREMIKKNEDLKGLIIEEVLLSEKYISVCTADNKAMLLEVHWDEDCWVEISDSSPTDIDFRVSFILGLLTEEERDAASANEKARREAFRHREEKETYERLKKKFESEGGGRR